MMRYTPNVSGLATAITTNGIASTTYDGGDEVVTPIYTSPSFVINLTTNLVFGGIDITIQSVRDTSTYTFNLVNTTISNSYTLGTLALAGLFSIGFTGADIFKSYDLLFAENDAYDSVLSVRIHLQARSVGTCAYSILVCK